MQSNAKALCAGIRKPPPLGVDVQTPINNISVTNSGEVVNDTGNDILIKPPSHFRPLTVTEISMNCSPAAEDCVFGAEVFPFTQRQLPPGIEKTVQVTVKVGAETQPIETCATINEVSRLFNFTEDQHRLFAIVGRAFLGHLHTEGEHFSMADSDLAGTQRLAHLHGMGGTGKSHIIQGLLALARSWSRPNAIGTFAITGVAAINVSGETFARLTCYFEKTNKITDLTKERRQSLRVAVLDEISMAGPHDIFLFDAFARKLTGRPALPFGGITVVLAGDFCQLKPVGGSFLYEPPPIGNVKKTIGFELWRTVTSDSVVVLNKVYLISISLCLLFKY